MGEIKDKLERTSMKLGPKDRLELTYVFQKASKFKRVGVLQEKPEPSTVELTTHLARESEAEGLAPTGEGIGGAVSSVAAHTNELRQELGLRRGLTPQTSLQRRNMATVSLLPSKFHPRMSLAAHANLKLCREGNLGKHSSSLTKLL